jgi:hypothetical protein
MHYTVGKRAEGCHVFTNKNILQSPHSKALSFGDIFNRSRPLKPDRRVFAPSPGQCTVPSANNPGEYQIHH